MTYIDKIFGQIRDVMRDQLFPLGFVIFDYEEDGPFGSKLISLHRNNQGIKFLWDGKESWFVLQDCEDVSVKPLPMWKDILFKRVDLDNLDDEKSEDLVSSFCKYVDQFAENFLAA
jgi:hypothetical protein